MVDEKNLEQFKNDFTEGYINTSLDRLLDLKNALRKATSTEEVRTLMNAEQAFVMNFYGLERKKVVHEKAETITKTP
ncbi:MAG: hypothetical protein KKH70_20950 [Gammaproteobacteria bacterium]|nr:hypothetical protein [Gammaproteobacteria bacterium]